MSDYAYERTLMMEQRSEIIKRLNINRKQSLLLEQEVDGRVIRFRIRKPSLCDFDETPPMLEMQSLQSPASLNGQPPELAMGASGPASDQSPQQQQQPMASVTRPDEANVRRMQTALALNEAILKRSKAAKLVIINLPGAPKESTPEAENNCKCSGAATDCVPFGSRAHCACRARN